MGVNFQRVLTHFGIKDAPTSVRNPQSNAVCERLNQSVGNALCLYLSQDVRVNVGNIAELVDSALATALLMLQEALFIIHSERLWAVLCSSIETCF
jgi:transposase InsO family protein